MTQRKETRDFPGFMFFPSYADAFFSGALDDHQIAELLRAMVEFMRSPDFEPQLDPPLNMAFSFVRPNLERSLEDWRNGKRGGRPPKPKGGRKNGNPPFNPPFNPPENPPENLEKSSEEKRSEEKNRAAPPALMGGGGEPLGEVGTCPRCGDFLSGPHGSRRCFAAGCGYVEGEQATEVAGGGADG